MVHELRWLCSFEGHGCEWSYFYDKFYDLWNRRTFHMDQKYGDCQSRLIQNNQF